MTILAPIVADSLGRWLRIPAYVVPGKAMPTDGPMSIYVASLYRTDKEGTTNAGRPYVQAMLSIGWLGFGVAPDFTGEWTGAGEAVRRLYAPDGVLLYPNPIGGQPRRNGDLLTVKVLFRAVQATQRERAA
ncbi:hypothetical protein [Asanoa iriomotensis]|uniref:Uncharacterized protein n=1 Tax=Asanoa iriomotensis TaxID=234613 RepID=A0ABQ4CBU6_9ACTN|nr:hypothetical protein [Asanoa iriomotensis]GIF60225.1 hypothetical protein Air01nite_63200 [Asanoa iriomotensis]